jgi:hypothetical protein
MLQISLLESDTTSTVYFVTALTAFVLMTLSQYLLAQHHLEVFLENDNWAIGRFFNRFGRVHAPLGGFPNLHFLGLFVAALAIVSLPLVVPATQVTSDHLSRVARVGAQIGSLWLRSARAYIALGVVMIVGGLYWIGIFAMEREVWT